MKLCAVVFGLLMAKNFDANTHKQADLFKNNKTLVRCISKSVN